MLQGVRIYELSRELGVSSKLLIELVTKMGYPVKSHSSSIDNMLANRLRRQINKMDIPETDIVAPKKADNKKSSSKDKDSLKDSEALVSDDKVSDSDLSAVEDKKSEPALSEAETKVSFSSDQDLQTEAESSDTKDAKPKDRLSSYEVESYLESKEAKSADSFSSTESVQSDYETDHKKKSEETEISEEEQKWMKRRRELEEQRILEAVRRKSEELQREKKGGQPYKSPKKKFSHKEKGKFREKHPARDGSPTHARSTEGSPGSRHSKDRQTVHARDGKDGKAFAGGTDDTKKGQHVRPASAPPRAGSGRKAKQTDDTARKRKLSEIKSKRDREEEDEARARRRIEEARLRKEREEEAEIQRLIDEEEERIRAIESRKISIDEHTSVREFAEILNIGANEIIKKLLFKGIMANLNQTINMEIAKSLATEMGYELVEKEDLSSKVSEDEQDRPEDLLPRWPVVTIMGHVDHGKTSLLDAIRKTKVTEQEAGGITQSIGAYMVKVKNGAVTFIDTPGHEAFTAMRARGTAVTDIVVLVVAADDGVMPQTIEAINHAKAADVPVLVAINKIDKPEANPEKIRQELSKYGIAPEEWGGTTIFCEISAKKGIGIEHMLEMLILQSEVLELKSNPDRKALGTIIESKLDIGRGPVATVLIQRGTLKIQDPFVSGGFSGKVRALINDDGKRVKEAGPSVPVEVLGFSGVPPAGEVFEVVSNDKEAASIANARQKQDRLVGLHGSKGRVKLENLHAEINMGKIETLNIIVKADVQGAIEAVNKALNQIQSDDVSINMLHGSVGAIIETDVSLAEASNAIIIGFNVRPTEKARSQAELNNVDIRYYSIIYDAIEDIKAAIQGMLVPELKEVLVGNAEVRNTFYIAKIGMIAGCMVTSGKLIRNITCRLVRDGMVVHTGKITSLKRFKDDAREVMAGYECGIGIERFNDIKVGDLIEAFEMKEIAKKIIK